MNSIAAQPPPPATDPLPAPGAASMRRVNLADRTADRARALMALAPGVPGAHRLLVESIETDPSFVNAYAALGEWLRQRGEDQLEGMMRVWEAHGQADPRALRFISRYRDGDPAARLACLCHRRGTGPSLIVDAADDLSYVDLYDYDGRPRRLPDLIGRIDNPRLVCSPRDFGGLPAAKQAVAEDAVKRGRDLRIVRHRDTTVHLASRTAFGPTIDSLYFNAALHETVYRSTLARRAGRVVEVGVGSGLLLCSALAALERRPLDVIGSDIDRSAVETTQRNLCFVLEDLPSRLQIDLRLEHRANLLEQLPPQSVDLLLASPPSVPEPRFRGENAFSGTRLLESILVDQAPRVLASGGVAVVLYSSLASSIVADCLRGSPLAAIPLAAPRRVPLDLRDVSSDPVWLAMLQREHGLESTLDDPAHAYWHTVRVIALCRPEDEAIASSLRGLAAANGA